MAIVSAWRALLLQALTRILVFTAVWYFISSCTATSEIPPPAQLLWHVLGGLHDAFVHRESARQVRPLLGAADLAKNSTRLCDDWLTRTSMLMKYCLTFSSSFPSCCHSVC